MKSYSALKNSALETLRGNWGKVIIIIIVYLVITVIIQTFSVFHNMGMLPYAYGFLFILIIPVLNAGLKNTFLTFYRQDYDPDNTLQIMFKPFKEYGRYWVTMILVMLYTILWSLLLIIPGIIKAFSYSMTPYILKDNPGLKYNAAIELSMSMMNGNKTRLFVLYLSFIGWFLLSVLTCGILFFWLLPYVETTKAAFYEDVKADYITFSSEE